MDLVFVNKDHVRSSLVTPEGNIYYHVSIEQPSIESSPVTRVEATRESLPLLPVSRKEFKRIPKSRDEVASIRWKDGAGNGASLHCKALDEGVCAKGFMRKKHALKLPSRRMFGTQKEQSFVGDDGLKYRWKMVPYGCILTQATSNVEVARCIRRRVKEGIFSDQKPRTTLHINQPEELTLDLGLLLTTFLWMDHPRVRKELVGNRSPRPPERPRCSSETERSL